jgi:hypothetical protein
MKQVFKLFIVRQEPYLAVDENVSVGDLAIVTVNDEYPSVVECMNELDLDDSITNYLDGRDGMIMVEVEDGNFKILNEEI